MTSTEIDVRAAGSGTPPTPPVPAGGGALRWWLPAAMALVTLGVLAAALRYGDGITAGVPGLPDPGTLTAWGLPLVRVAADLAAAVTVGLTVTAAFLLPGKERTVGPQAYRLRGIATWWALCWAAAALGLLLLTASDLFGRPLSGVSPTAVLSFAVDVPEGRALLVQAGMALVLAGMTRGLSRSVAAWTALLALATVLPPALTGHAAGAGNHQIAVTSLALHVLAAAVWVGGLAALVVLRRSGALAGVAARYSRIALLCWILVAVSGLANAWVRLGGASQLWESGYGTLVLGKVAALTALGLAGLAHRRRMLPALRAGRRGAFLRLAIGELLLFGGTFGLAVALSRTPTPVPVDPAQPDPAVDILGFPVPEAPTVSRMLFDVLPDMFFLTLVGFGVVGYLVGVWRMRRAGNAWPWWRTASWLAGMAVLFGVTNLGVARYAYVLFSVHMAQHMVLSMLVPILLVLGAPATLALRTLRRGEGGVRGAREWLLIVLHSRAVKLFTHPLVALAIYVFSLYALYLSTGLTWMMRYHLGHLAMLVHFVAAGYLLFWVIIGIDPGRRRLAAPLLVLIHFVGMIFHAFFGIVLLQSASVIAPDWYGPIHPDWGPGLMADQRLGASIAWAFGEIPAAVVFVILVVQWIRSDEREQQRLDRAAARADATGEEDELARYNEFLRRAAEESRPGAGPR